MESGLGSFLRKPADEAITPPQVGGLFLLDHFSSAPVEVQFGSVLNCTLEPLYTKPVIPLIKRAQAGVRSVAEEKERIQDHTQPKEPTRCPACAAFPRLSQQFMNSRDGKTVRLYECPCGERIWDEK